MNNTNDEKKTNGLPDVANVGVYSRRIVLIMIATVIALSIGIYFFLGSKKEAVQTVEETYAVQTAAEADHNKLDLPAATSATVASTTVAPQVTPEVMQQQIALIQEKQKELRQRLSAPLLVVNASQASSEAGLTQQAKQPSSDANTRFMNQVAGQSAEESMASKIGPLNAMIVEGSLIHAILETATDSDLPGYLRATVSMPVYSEDGTQVLIQPGSRLIGQYKSGVAQGQSRIFIVWTRLITAGGFSINLGSPGVDNLGMAGMGADEINRHFWERFGNASLLSLIGAGVANVGVSSQDQANSAGMYREAVATSFSQSANEALQQDNRIAPTLKSYQGKPIMVFVARDLNFQAAIQQRQSSINLL